MAAAKLRLDVMHTRYTIEVPKGRAQALFTMEEPTLLDRLGVAAKAKAATR